MQTSDHTFFEWMHEVANADSSKFGLVQNFLAQDQRKIERLIRLNKEIKIPIDNYMIVNGEDFEFENSDLNDYFVANSDSLYALRMVPLVAELGVKRVLGITRKECFDYVNSVPRGRASYRIYLWDYFVPEYSGSMIVTKQGLYAEMVHGRHIQLTQQMVTGPEIIVGQLFFPFYRMIYSVSDQHERIVLWLAAKFLIMEKKREISPHLLPTFCKGYFEFVYHSKKGYRFIDYNDNILISSLAVSASWPDIFA